MPPTPWFQFKIWMFMAKGLRSEILHADLRYRLSFETWFRACLTFEIQGFWRAVFGGALGGVQNFEALVQDLAHNLVKTPPPFPHVKLHHICMRGEWRGKIWEGLTLCYAYACVKPLLCYDVVHFLGIIFRDFQGFSEIFRDFQRFSGQVFL